MFVSLRDKLQTVQEGLTASLRGLTGASSNQTSNTPNINVNAGADILHHYQRQWFQLDRLAEMNATKAEEVDRYIGDIDRRVDQEWAKMGVLCSNLARIPQMTKDIENLITNIGSLHKLTGDIENMLVQLEDTIEMQKLEEKQLDERFRMALYREKRLHQLEKATSKLSREHLTKVDHHKNKLELVLKERHTTFGDAFNSDIEEYKKFGAVPFKSITEDRNFSLDEVELDFDSDEINDFVNS